MRLIVWVNYYEVIFVLFYELFWLVFVYMNFFFVYFIDIDLMCCIWIEFFILVSLGYLGIFDFLFLSRFKKVFNSVYFVNIICLFVFFFL